MSVLAQPFPLPEKLPTPLTGLHHYWTELIRAENEMPFADDVNLSQVPALAGNLLLVDVFAKPQRFRFNHLGDELTHRLGTNRQIRRRGRASRPFRVLHRASERYARSARANLLL
jgi:hypothetical protein